ACFFFFQAEDGIRDRNVTGVQTCALPILQGTDQLIQDLIPPGALTARERLVLVSALHVKAAWPSPLSSAPGTFTTAPGQQREVRSEERRVGKEGRHGVGAAE